MATKTDICNLALSLIGGSPLQTANVDTDTTAQGKVCKKWFDTARDESLASHPWNFAMKRELVKVSWNYIDQVSDVSGTISVSNGSGLHNLMSESRVKVRGVRGVESANGTWTITVSSTSDFELQGSVFSGTHVTLTGEWTLVPKFGWEYESYLPGDCLRVCAVNATESGEDDSIIYAVEGRKLLVNEERVRLLYVSSVTDPVLWPPDFCNAFAMLLGSYIAQELMGPSGKSAELRQQYETAVSPKLRGRDARQGKLRRLPLSYGCDVVGARRGLGFEDA